MAEHNDHDLIIETSTNVKWIRSAIVEDRKTIKEQRKDIDGLKRFRYYVVGFVAAIEALLHVKEYFKG